MVQQVQPLSKTEYKTIVKRNFTRGAVNDEAIVKEIMPLVHELPKLATGIYFWRIYSKANYCIDAGGSVQSLTPYTAEELIKSTAPDELMIAATHPDDREFCFSFIEKFSSYVFTLPVKERNKQSINLYLRIRQKDATFKWINVQYPYSVFDEEGREKGGLIV